MLITSELPIIWQYADTMMKDKDGQEALSRHGYDDKAHKELTQIVETHILSEPYYRLGQLLKPLKDYFTSRSAAIKQENQQAAVRSHVTAIKVKTLFKGRSNPALEAALVIPNVDTQIKECTFYLRHIEVVLTDPRLKYPNPQFSEHSLHY